MRAKYKKDDKSKLLPPIYWEKREDGGMGRVLNEQTLGTGAGHHVVWPHVK